MMWSSEKIGADHVEVATGNEALLHGTRDSECRDGFRGNGGQAGHGGRQGVHRVRPRKSIGICNMCHGSVCFGLVREAHTQRGRDPRRACEASACLIGSVEGEDGGEEEVFCRCCQRRCHGNRQSRCGRRCGPSRSGCRCALSTQKLLKKVVAEEMF